MIFGEVDRKIDVDKPATIYDMDLRFEVREGFIVSSIPKCLNMRSFIYFSVKFLSKVRILTR